MKEFLNPWRRYLAEQLDRRDSDDDKNRSSDEIYTKVLGQALLPMIKRILNNQPLLTTSGSSSEAVRILEFFVKELSLNKVKINIIEFIHDKISQEEKKLGVNLKQSISRLQVTNKDGNVQSILSSLLSIIEKLELSLSSKKNKTQKKKY